MMPYNYLELVNKICRKVNEVELTEANFIAAQGFYALAKDAVNRAIKDINNSEDNWRFNYRERILLVGPNEPRYDLPVNNTTVDFHTFRLGTNVELLPPGTGDWWDATIWADADTYTDVLTFAQAKNLSFKSKPLKLLDYNHYLHRYGEDEFSEARKNEPTHCVKTPTDHFILYPAPLNRHPLFFDYYVVNTPLSLPTDVPTIPEKYDFVIFTGAMRDVYTFREDDFNSEKSEVYFRNQIKEMRRREINLYTYVRSGQF